MEISALVDSISSFLNLSSSRHIDLDPFDKYYKRVQELSKPMAVATVLNSDLVLEEKLCKSFQELTQDVDHSRDLFTSWHPFSSKVYFVLQIESLIPKMPDTIVDTFQFLKSSKHDLPDELSPASLQKCLEKIKHLSYEEISSVIDGALRDHREAVGPTPEILVKIGENTGLRSNQEILIEAVALERQKEIAEQSENNAKQEIIKLEDQNQCFIDLEHEYNALVKFRLRETLDPKTGSQKRVSRRSVSYSNSENCS